MGSTPLFGLQPVLLSSNLASVVRKSTQATVSRAVQCWGVGQRDRPELICCQQTSHATPLGYMVNWGECIVLVYTECMVLPLPLHAVLEAVLLSGNQPTYPQLFSTIHWEIGNHRLFLHATPSRPVSLTQELLDLSSVASYVLDQFIKAS